MPAIRTFYAVEGGLRFHRITPKLSDSPYSTNRGRVESHLIRSNAGQHIFGEVRTQGFSINSALRALAPSIALVVCCNVLVFDPKTTVPPITAPIAPIITVGSNLITPTMPAKSKTPP